MPKPIHQVFNVAYNGIARSLTTEVVIIDPLTNKTLSLKRAVWDTGATASVINMGIATAMELKPTGMTRVHTANGLTTANTYVIGIGMPHKVAITGLNVSEGNLGPDVDVLIGMDVISMGDFTVQNFAGKTHFSFAIPPFENKYLMLQKANLLNPKHQRQNMKHPGRH